MDENKSDVIAIDGPAGSGKSTTARLVAQKLGFTYLDTGAMYRAFTLKALRKGIDLRDKSKILSLIPNTSIALKGQNTRVKIILDGEDVTHKIRTPKVSAAVSIIAADADVRKWMVKLQRKMGERGKVIAEGRDIGTVVFPQARLKIFLVASLEQRAKRRYKDFSGAGEAMGLEKVKNELNQRDFIDSTREIAPLKKADDAIELDTTNLTIEQQVDYVVQLWKKI